MALFCVLVGVANLWLARVELENATEAAALAAVKAWGDVGGGSTLAPRNVGVAFAHANSVRRDPVVIGANFNPGGGPNQNDVCKVGISPPSGNLIFGSINDDDPDNIIFNAGVMPGCGLGTVLVDATASGSGNLAQDNAWGVSFYHTATVPSGLRIDRVLIDLNAGGGSGSFSGSAILTDNSPQPAVTDGVSSQPDLLGFTDPTAQIQFSYPSAGQVQIDFLPDSNPAGGVDDGFAPGDRFRFGQDVTNVSSGNGKNDGDGIGQDRTSVTIFFSLGGAPLPPVTGNIGVMVDNTETNNPPMSAIISPTTGTLIVNPALVPDLPPPATSAANNNGQSYVLVNSIGNGKFGVRAQAMVPVQPLGFKPFLGNITEYCIQAKATAVYDCATQRVRLIRIDTFICP
jgi:hypothetical protein